MDMGLNERVAIVTGSSKGLGFASAKALVSEGCRIALCARTPQPLHEARRQLAEIAGGEDRVLAIEADVSREDGARAIVSEAVAAFGGVDILVNNVATARGVALLETTDEQWQEAFDQTLMPAVRMSRLVVPHMKRRGGGSIIVIASVWGREAGGRMTYNVVKAGEISLAKSLAQQFASSNIRVNSVAPGSILFEGGSWWKRQRDDPEGIAEFVRRELPFGRFGRPDEVANVVAFLASDRASWVSGTCVVVDGCQSRSF